MARSFASCEGRNPDCARWTQTLGAVLVGLTAACSASSMNGDGAAGAPTLDAGSAGVRARYELGRAPMRFGAIPWPDEAYRDEQGRVRVRELPDVASTELAEALAAALAQLDGFGTQPTVYFSFDGELDPSSLPRSPEATLEVDASVFLIDADTSSPEAFERIPADVHYEPEHRQIRLRPAFGRALHPGRLYAAVVTRRVRSEDGQPIEGAERFVAIRDAEAALSDPLERAARARYAPVLETLAGNGVRRDRVAALAVFRVQTVRTDLVDARALLRASGPVTASVSAALGADDLDTVLGNPPEGDVGLDRGAPHEHIGWMVHGRFPSPNLLSARPAGHGAIERRGSELLVKRTDDVPFSLWLPQGIAPGARLPVVIVQHGLGGERSDALALANALASSGYAVIAIDAPFHGLRSPAGDRASRFTSANTPDGFGDAPGDFAGAGEGAGEFPRLHPFYYRDAVRQGVIDLMQLVHLIEAGDLSDLQAVAPALDGVELDPMRVGYVGVDLGADMGALLAAVEPQIGAVVLAFASGSSLDAWAQSPARTELVEQLFERLGLDPPSDAEELASALSSPGVDAWRALADRGSALAYARALRRLPVNALLFMARDDEVAPNAGTEALAEALSAVLIGGEPQYVPGLPTDTLRPGTTESANVAVEGGAVTRVLYLLEPAAHDTLMRAESRFEYEHPVRYPFEERAAPQAVDNPISPTLDQIAFFFESYRACASAGPSEPCAASVVAPARP